MTGRVGGGYTPEAVAALLDGAGLHQLANRVRDAALRCRPATVADPQPARRPRSRGRLLAEEGEGVVVRLDADPPAVTVCGSLRGGEAVVVGAARLERLGHENGRRVAA